MTHFGDRLSDANRRCRTPLCLGIDPQPRMIPALFGDASAHAGSDAAIRAIGDFSMACVEQAIGKVAAIKPQAAFFEQHGPAGMQILQNLGRAAIDSDLLVIMDAKRGDIGSTSSAYAAGWIGHDAPFPSDALTINPWLGIDTLDPFLERADENGSGLFILNRTSNPGAADLQDQIVDGQPLYLRLATLLAPLVAKRDGKQGSSSLGIVAGATWPEEAQALRATLPSAPFLIPGFGAQGAGPKQATSGLIRGKHGWEGGLVNSTRELIFPKAAACAPSLTAWKSAIAANIDKNKAILNSTF